MTRNAQSLNFIHIAQVLFYLNAVIWSALGVASLLRFDKANPSFVSTATIIAMMMFGNAGAMVISGIGLGTRRRGFYVLALAVLLINILLTFTDEFGLFDFLTLVLDLAILALLIATGKRYVRRDDRE